MKQLFVLALLTLGLTIVVPTALPAAGDPQGPPCANITSGDGGYSADVIDFTVFLQAPACSFVTYSFFVTDTSGNAIEPVAATQDSTSCTPETPDGGCVEFVYTLPSGSLSTVCIYATTDIHGHLADRAPNVSQLGCPASSPSISLVNTGVSPGGVGFT